MDEAGDLAGVIARDGVPMETALRLAAARLDLSRIRNHRLRVAQQLAEGAEQGPQAEALVDELRRIDRYEGRALSRWRKALRE